MAAEKQALSIQFPATQLQQMESNVVKLREQLKEEAEARAVVETLVKEEEAARAIRRPTAYELLELGGALKAYKLSSGYYNTAARALLIESQVRGWGEPEEPEEAEAVT